MNSDEIISEIKKLPESEIEKLIAKLRRKPNPKTSEPSKIRTQSPPPLVTR